MEKEKKIARLKKTGRWTFSVAETCGLIAEKAGYVTAGAIILGATFSFITDMCQRKINKLNKRSK